MREFIEATAIASSADSEGNPVAREARSNKANAAAGHGARKYGCRRADHYGALFWPRNFCSARVGRSPELRTRALCHTSAFLANSTHSVRAHSGLRRIFNHIQSGRAYGIAGDPPGRQTAGISANTQ